MKDREIQQHGDWNIATARCRQGGFVSWAKMGPITGSDPIEEAGQHVWFQFGETRESAVYRLKTELGIN